MFKIFRKFSRPTSAIFILLIVGNVLTPSLTWALTSGPTAPEATSFEPVDTTDMVNLGTGDFTYNIPLLEVPGPAGGYPLSLSYHAGIQPNEDASWVGLGWTLNPGAINRITNGLPDDFNGAKTTNRVYWQGGTTETNTFGVSVGIANVATVSGGLSFSQDTYRGSGVGGYLGASLGYNFKGGSGVGGNIGINAQVGVSPYGDTYSSIGIGLSIGKTGKMINVSASVGLSINSSGNVNSGLSGGISYKNIAAMGVSDKGVSGNVGSLGAHIGSGGSSISFGRAGFTSASNNSKDGQISTSVDDFQIDIPVYYLVNVHLGRTHVRYWMDETANLENYGSAFFPYSQQLDLKSIVFDSYHVQSYESMKTGDNPAKSLGGSFADYDQYSVNAQGLAGNIRPHHYTLSLYSQDIVKESDGTKEVLGYNIPQHSLGVQYRFINDFSNKVINNPPDIEVNKIITQTYYQPSPDPGENEWKSRLKKVYPVTTSTTIPLFFPYGSPETGVEGDASNLNLKRRIPYVPGSKHVEYFTNDDIINSLSSQKSKGFIDCKADGFVRSKTDGKVGAFTITNQSGVNYHFSLPAYAYNENTYSGKVDEKGRLSFNLVSQTGKYAYTWYLTGMTGPDYVDRGPSGVADGLLNEYDWGYWVDFQYGKWTDNYAWRNPSEGFNEDIDHRFQTFSSGNKEVYYLNAIKTKTNTAFFVKQIRADGRSLKEESPINNVSSPSIENVSKGTFYPWSTASLRLNSILLFDNKDLGTVNYNSLSNNYIHTFTETKTVVIFNPRTGGSRNTFTITRKIHSGQNVLDKFDIANAIFPKDKAIRVIDFDSDYSLTNGTSNSFDPDGKLYVQKPDANLVNIKFGKLSLNSITFKGKGGASNLIPATKFYYDLKKQDFKGQINSVDGVNKTATIAFYPNSGAFGVGDIISFSQSGNQYYGYIKDSPSAINNIGLLSTATPSSGAITNVNKSKNPPYNKDAYDLWGLYKSDFQDRRGFHLNRYTSEISAKNIDAWSLREIENSTGSKTKIEYESDTYGNVAIKTASISLASDIIYDTKSTDKPQYCGDVEGMVLVASNFGSFDFTKRFKVDDYTQTALQINYEIRPNPREDKPTIYITECNNYTNKVLAVTKDQLRILVCTRVTDRQNYDPNIYTVIPSLGAGKLYLPTGNLVPGGGLRVKSLSLENPSTGELRSTNYTYDYAGVSSGSTSYEPVPSLADQAQTETCYNDTYQTNLLKTLSLARDIPSPGVFYQKVRVSEEIKGLDDINIAVPGYTEYAFETFDRDMIDYSNRFPTYQSVSGTHRSQSYSTIRTTQVVLKDFTQRVGRLKSITLYDNGGRKVNETVHHYLHDEQNGQSFNDNITQYESLLNRFNKQGLIQETFNHARLVKSYENSYQLLGIISKKENFPAIQTGTTTVNFKTGITTENRNLAFDFYNGSVIKSLEVDGNGNSYVTETNYAYHNYPAMGLKANYLQDNSSNRHMIDQQSSSTTYKVSSPSDLTPVGLVSASAQTWSDQTDVIGVVGGEIQDKQLGIWRKKSTFNFIGPPGSSLLSDGLLPMASFGTFSNWSSDAEQLGWQKGSEITKYDYFSHAIEAKDINGNFAATKFSYDRSKVFATAANAGYKDFAFSSAEELPTLTTSNLLSFGGGVICAGTQSRDQAHTGQNSVKALANSRAFTYVLAPDQKIYHVSVWSSQQDAKIKYKLNNGALQAATTNQVGKSGTWTLLEADIPITQATSSLEIGCESSTSITYFDDFRVHPSNSSMTSYVYNSWNELTHILDNNNLYTEYEYDDMGRLTKIFQESFKNTRTLLTETKYHYANQ